MLIGQVHGVAGELRTTSARFLDVESIEVSCTAIISDFRPLETTPYLVFFWLWWDRVTNIRVINQVRSSDTLGLATEAMISRK